ncbi:hypothetical protein K227x_49210 [Rubripirellula lacrimiformis]|uniref:SGNH hydrolase-type esterase domain-containing protein n=1 Tax=Rubripirellula lacrimiformis TaxID=1930273 RepID=A0A517NH92_9BACT|nr:GDSL-type esterase/lipase family protein [Rubripirellula lacrimiformis]QDT06511.1 hypothetical protein K227x_49210 [Rubripirellula lacrimiformis]
MPDAVPSDSNRRSRPLMAAAAVALALLPFAALECGVRRWAPLLPMVDADPVAGYQELPPLFQFVDDADGPADDVTNASGGRWQIAESRMNFFRPASFAATKSPHTRRVFVLGGSTVQGRPFSTQTAFPNWLRLKLETADPKHHYEVVNCGGVSYASYRVAKILDEVLRHKPDAIVLYTGHNEFLEDRSYQHVRKLGTARRVVTRAASYWKTVGWLQSLASAPSQSPPSQPASQLPLAGRPLASEVDTRLDHIGGMDLYQRDPEWRRSVEQQFAATLQRMIRATSAANVPLIVCVPACDLVNTPPFKVDDLATGDAYRRGKELWDAGGSAAEAKQWLTQARDDDLCPLRATSTIIDTVRDACAIAEIPMVDVPQCLDQRSGSGARVPDGIADPEFFADHVHPTVAGHQRIAAAVADRFEELGWCQFDDASEAEFQLQVASVMQSLDETYFARGRQRLQGLRRWAAGRAATPIAEDEKALE